MSKKEKNCLNCRIHWDREGGCEVCRWEDENNPSLYYRITRSPEVLAPQFIFKQWHAFDGKWGWFSLLLMDGDELNSPWFDSYEEAISATVAKLKEVAE